MELQIHAGGHSDSWGEFIAWNPLTGESVWSIPESFMTMSGALATAGDLVFYGTTDGWFRAVDARTARCSGRRSSSSGITAQPMTYLGPDGRQYVAVDRRRRRRRQPGDGREERLPAARRNALRLLDRRRFAAAGPGMLTTEGAVRRRAREHGMGGKP